MRNQDLMDLGAGLDNKDRTLLVWPPGPSSGKSLHVPVVQTSMLFDLWDRHSPDGYSGKWLPATRPNLLSVRPTLTSLVRSRMNSDDGFGTSLI